MASPPVVASSRMKARQNAGAASDGSVKESAAELRRLVARELHDRVAQTLTGMLVDLENFKTDPVGWDDVLRQLDTVQDSTRQVLQSLRELLHDLRGEETFGDGFVDAVGALVAGFEEKTAIKSELNVHPGWPQSLTTPASVNLYRIIEEALSNVRRHSGAHAVRIFLQPHSDSEVAVIVVDNGRGVESDRTWPAGMGTVGMKERVVILGGELFIDSVYGDGTTVRAIFPKQQLTPRPRADYDQLLD
ncbi:MAG TPA: sensor histidine kinase [Candidatus Dormibacteraeota bacterium]|nr:sensor histidine kinase [Candidatus Dormibacteraeota bacterium]